MPSEMEEAEVVANVMALVQDFQTSRLEDEDHRDLYALRKIPNLPEDLARDAQVNILSPDLIHATHTIRSQLLSFATEFQAVPKGRTAEGSIPARDKTKADNLEKVDSIFWGRVNKNRRLDRGGYWSQLVQQAALFVMEVDGIETLDPAERFPWSVFQIPLETAAWLEEKDIPTQFGRHFKQQLHHIGKAYSRKRGSEWADADLYNEKGRWEWKKASDDYDPRLTMNSANRAFPEGELVWFDNGTTIYTVALNSPEHNESRFTVGPFHAGRTDKRTGVMIQKTENPFGRVSAFVVPGNDTPMTRPQDRYEPYLLPLMMIVEQMNVIDTMRATTSRNRAAPRDYVMVDPQIATEYLRKDGKMPDAIEWADGRTPYVAGEIKQRPVDVDPDLDKLDERLDQRMNRYLPTSGAQLTDPQVVANATAAGILAAIDANVLLLSPLIGNNDTFKKQIVEAFHHSLGWFKAKGKDYADFDLMACGEEMVRGKYLNSGEKLRANADALDFPHEIRVTTRSMTTAQVQAQYEISRQRMEPLPDGSPGVGTREDVQAAANITDPTAQDVQKAKELITVAAEPAIRQQAILAVQRKIFLTSGIMVNLAPDPMAGTAPAPGGGGNGLMGSRTNSPASQQVSGGSDAVLT